MSRTDTRRWTPPVRIGLAQARVQGDGMQTNVVQTARGAGDYGAREPRFASVPIALRIHRSAGPNTTGAQAAALPMGVTRRKRGFPAIVELPKAK